MQVCKCGWIRIKNSHHVVHLAAFLRLLPLEACRYANVDGSGSRGPDKLIMAIAEIPNTKSEYRYSDLKKRIPKEVAKIIFHEIHEDLANIFGKDSVSKDKLENIFCELWRLFDNWIKQTKVRTSKSLFNHSFHPIITYLTKSTSTYKISDVLGTYETIQEEGPVSLGILCQWNQGILQYP
jgi:hypothetical protein